MSGHQQKLIVAATNQVGGVPIMFMFLTKLKIWWVSDGWRTNWESKTKIDMEKRVMESVVSEHGPWTAHNIRLGKGLYTMPEGQGLRYKRRSEIYEFLYKNTLNKAIDNIKVLDLGCLEGGIGIHFGLKGADVTGIDIRNLILKNVDSRQILSVSQIKLDGELQMSVNQMYGEISENSTL